MSLAEKVAELPLSPGVYLMKDSLGHIIYVGKAKQLKKRVQSYFYNSTGHSPKVKQLVRNIKDLDYILTDTEFEAFMLECQLIKEIKPMYNKKMKNPLAYTYIAVRMAGLYRQLEVTYDSKDDEHSLYFGPYTSRSTVERAVLGIKENQKILCSSPRNTHTLCLNHSLGLCLGMCAGGEALEKYNEIMDRIIALLHGTDTSLLSDLEWRMSQAAEKYDFETAAKYRDYTGAVSSLLQKEKVIGFTEENKNIVVLEPMNEYNLKLILIKGSVILYHAKLDTRITDPNQQHVHIRSAITDHFMNQVSEVREDLSRHKLDEAQIIYSYLTSRSGSYLIIPDEWLVTMTHTRLDEAVHELLNSYYSLPVS